MRVMVRLMTVVCVAIVSVAAAGRACADVNQTPIAVPLIGDHGVGSPYPSTINLVSRGGPGVGGQISVTLHAVTHPCVEDLAVLLVHNGTEKYLLLSNAGGCRALQGTDVIFAIFGAAIPDTDPVTSPYGQSVTVLPSSYGTDPVFPAPAPAGPYTHGLPSALTPVQGTWDLYVMDTHDANRGVIGAGWSLNYPTLFGFGAHDPAPYNIPDVGADLTYPITFDLTSVPAGVKAWNIKLLLQLSHTRGPKKSTSSCRPRTATRCSSCPTPAAIPT
jgi:hypothetical protein